MKTRKKPKTITAPYEWHDVYMTYGGGCDSKGIPPGPELEVYLSWNPPREDEKPGDDDTSDLYRFAIVGPAGPLADAMVKNAALEPLFWEYLEDHPEHLVAINREGSEVEQVKLWALGDQPTSSD